MSLEMQHYNSNRQLLCSSNRHEELASIWGSTSGASLLFASDAGASDNNGVNLNELIADFGQLGWRRLSSCDDISEFSCKTEPHNLPDSERKRDGQMRPQPIGTPHAQPMHQQLQPLAKLGIGHEIDRWIASVTCCAPLQPSTLSSAGDINSGHHRQQPELGSNRIVVDKSTLLAFLAKLKMHHQKRREMRIELCAFCRQNQEPFHVYTSHRLADINGNVTCPVLFRYVCPICGASGSKAHTIKYCPLGNGSNGQTQRQRLESLSSF